MFKQQNGEQEQFQVFIEIQTPTLNGNFYNWDKIMTLLEAIWLCVAFLKT